MVRTSKRLAVTLLETIFAFALLGLLVTMVFHLLPSSVVAVKRGEEQLQAETLARSTVEEVRSAAFASLSNGTTTLTSPDPQFSVQREVFDPAGCDPARTKGVRVTVGWTSRGRQHQIERELWVSSVRP